MDNNVNFNPRSHEGSDTCVLMMASYHINFNPRSHEGSDLECLKGYHVFMISILAPTRGATFMFRLYYKFY